MNRLSESAERCLIVVDDNKLLLGTVNDGDLRRGFLKGLNADSYIESIYCRTPYVAVSSDHTVEDIKSQMLEHKTELVPVVDLNNKVMDYYTWSGVFGGTNSKQPEQFSAHVVIMAGGKGERLKPFTNILPKPLVPIHDKPIIQHIIDKFTPYGLKDFYLTLNYKSRIIKAFFEEEEPDYNLHYVYENKPLGTAGSLSYLEGKMDAPFIVTNCDIIVKADYAEIYKYHLEHDNAITLVASANEHTIPYGICKLSNNGHLSHIVEKPTHYNLINTGYYILNPDIIELIKKDELYNMTDLIKDARDKNLQVGVYTVGESDWIDIGQWKEYLKATELL